MALEGVETGELIDRYKILILDYQQLSIELAKYLEKYGKVRKELEILVNEFKERKINIEEIDVSIK